MSYEGTNHAKGTVSRLTSEAVAANLLVAQTSTAGTVNMCDAGLIPVAIAYEAVGNGARGDFQLLTSGDLVLCTGTGIVVGDYVKAGTDGIVVVETSAATATAFTLGVCESLPSASLVAVRWA